MYLKDFLFWMFFWFIFGIINFTMSIYGVSCKLRAVYVQQTIL